MPYRRNDYSFVVDSTFRPFSFQEMVQPLALYKDAYDKNEEAYQDLIDKTNTFAYLEQVAKNNPNSVAAQIYKGYADEMNRQFDDFSRNGLSMGNRRALVNLKRRYNGEIGRLDRARTSMEEERKRRQAMNAKDSSMLYATDNLDIDQFLDENTPNLYAISGNDLQALGANLGKAISSREYSAGDAGPVLRDYYRDWVEKVGISQDSIAAFMQRPEVLQEVDNILKAQGASGNLSGNNLDRARQNVMNGIYSGIVYQESHKPVRDAGVLSQSERASLNMQREQMEKTAAQNGLTWNKDTKSWNYSLDKDPVFQRQKAIAEKKKELGLTTGKPGGSGSGSKGTSRYPVHDKSEYVSGMGSTYVDDGSDESKELMNGYRKSATKVNVGIDNSGTKWEVSIGHGKNKQVIGTISKRADGKYEIKQKNIFKYSNDDDVSKVTRTYNSNLDTENAESLLYDIVNRMSDEGDFGYRNYQWYFSPKGASDKIDDGGFLRDPLKRDYPTLYNGIFEGQEDDESYGEG